MELAVLKLLSNCRYFCISISSSNWFRKLTPSILFICRSTHPTRALV